MYIYCLPLTNISKPLKPLSCSLLPSHSKYSCIVYRESLARLHTSDSHNLLSMPCGEFIGSPSCMLFWKIQLLLRIFHCNLGLKEGQCNTDFHTTIFADCFTLIGKHRHYCHEHRKKSKPSASFSIFSFSFFHLPAAKYRD